MVALQATEELIKFTIHPSAGHFRSLVMICTTHSSLSIFTQKCSAVQLPEIHHFIAIFNAWLFHFQIQFMESGFIYLKITL